jgi:1-acyl-sn-glycerol-3-phosphate acyltransferase
MTNANSPTADAAATGVPGLVDHDESANVLRFARAPAGRALTALLLRYFDARLENAEGIPANGAALLVSNHATFGIDSFVLAALVIAERQRHVRFLVERNLARHLPYRAFFRAIAALPGSQEAAVAALTAGELVGVYPGGIDESFKLSRYRHQLRWGARNGFARAAMRAGVPIVPIAGVGIDDMYRVVLREPRVGRWLFGSSRYDLPLAFGAFGTPIPRRPRMRFVVLPPIDTRGDPTRPGDVERVRVETFQALDRVLALAR